MQSRRRILPNKASFLVLANLQVKYTFFDLIWPRWFDPDNLIYMSCKDSRKNPVRNTNLFVEFFLLKHGAALHLHGNCEIRVRVKMKDSNSFVCDMLWCNSSMNIVEDFIVIFAYPYWHFRIFTWLFLSSFWLGKILVFVHHFEPDAWSQGRRARLLISWRSLKKVVSKMRRNEVSLEI